jgi:hypothetical protein
MIVYKTTNLVTGMSYIGKDASDNPKYLGSGLLLKSAIRKYGKSNFVKEVLEVCTRLEQLAARELYWIQFYHADTNPLYYNIAVGGLGGDTFTNHPNKENIRAKNSHAGRIWIKNIITNEFKLIKPCILEDGWVKSAPPSVINWSTKCTVWVHDPTNGKGKMIKPESISEYLATGWVSGRAPRSGDWNLNNKNSQIESSKKRAQY